MNAPDTLPAGDATMSARSAPDIALGPPRRITRGRLFRKYLLLILSLVTIALLASGGISIYFTYQENKLALASLQHEKALAAASRIEQYIDRIEQQLGYAALPQLDASDVELRRIEFLKLLRQAPEVTDIAQLDATGHEQIAVSRLGMDNIGSGKDRSEEPGFRNARRGQPWFGPVYFRKETEPYMTIALRSGGDKGPVILADVNLKFIWDVVSRIKIGEKGKAYVVDGNGFLVADPDIGLVLRKTNLSQLPHVKAAIAGERSDALAMISKDLTDIQVLTSVAAIESLHWHVFVEQPVAEVYENLYASILRTGLLLLVGMAISAIGAWALARGMVRPIRTLEEGAQRIGEGNLDQKIDIRTGDELEALANRFNRMSGQLRESYAGLERKVEERTRELQNSLEQQTAISEILRVISSSPTDVQPVLDAVAERAAHLCDSPFARVLLVDGDTLRPAAVFSREDIGRTLQTVLPTALKRSSINGRAVLDRETIHIADIVPLFDSEYPDARGNAVPAGVRAALAVPLVREDAAYGSIYIFRRQPGLFSPDQVALLQTFARQAAIAIDNVRLFNETKSSLEQQTAISEILRVISSSPTDVQPVLDAVAERAAHLCGAPFARVVLIDGDELRPAADYAMENERLAQPPRKIPLKRSVLTGRAALDRKTIHHADVLPLLDTEYPDSRESLLLLRPRAVLAVPLMREGGAYGGIFLFRREPKLFSPDQVAVVETFARQAAIAIDNVRLFNETKEALEQQTAISEILRVIASSPGDVRPMLNTVTERALKLCNAEESGIFLIEGDMVRFAAGFGTMATPDVGERFPLTREIVVGRATIEGKTIHHSDIVPLIDTEYPEARGPQQRFGFRAILAVPLMREDRAIGGFSLWRRDPRAFTEKQVALVKTFADQAAIAIENVRLFNETKEALEQQTAISEVLRVISSSPGDVRPMLNAVAERALKLCDAAESTIVLVEGDKLRTGAHFGSTPTLEEGEFMPLTRGSITGRAIIDRTLIHMEDLATAPEDEFPVGRELQRRFGHHTILSVPLMREARAIGAIALFRMETKRFTDKQIALVRTFADQAAIAIENVRLFNETKEALGQQRASGEVLAAISSSIADTAPVFYKILESCERLFAGKVAGVNLVGEDGLIHLQAYHGPGREDLERVFPLPVDISSGSGAAVFTRTVIHYPDVESGEGVPEHTRRACKAVGYKAVVFAPMIWEGKGIGVIFVGRDYVGAFSEKDIALLKTFADQAVIAIQNARLFNETKEALERQTATSEILRVISGSPTDTQPVFDSIAERAAILCSASMGIVTRFDGELIHMVAIYGVSRQGTEAIRAAYPIKPGSTTLASRLIQGKVPLQIADVFADAEYGGKEIAETVGFRSIMGVPMLRKGEVIGAITVCREPAGTFPEKQVDLLKTFADQAVIAIDNVRLFNETKEALERQTAIAEILRVISGSPTDVQPVLDAIAERAARLCDASSASMYLTDGDMLRHLASKGPSPDPVSHVVTLPIDRNSISGRALLERKTIEVEDMLAKGDEYPLSFEIAKRYGHRTVVVVPLFREGRPFGTILLRRQEVRAFGDREIALLSTFGDQAAIALENVRLFNETKEALEQQQASGDVLAAISSSIADATPVFEKILMSCERLFAGTVISVNVVGEDSLLRTVAHHGHGRQSLMQQAPVPINDQTATGVCIMGRRVLHFPDVENDETVPPLTRESAKIAGAKAAVWAPMLWEGKGIGSISVGRDRIGPFSDKEIALLKTFADQSVIAIQNARLFNETKEALDQQRASGEVLAAISSSIADTAPVFEKILSSAERLFAGKVISINLLGEDGRIHMAAYHGPDREKLQAAVYDGALAERESGTSRSIARRIVLHYPDIANDPDAPPGVRIGSGAVGVKAGLVAPMIWEGKGIGAIVVGRDYVGPFSEKDIALLKTFADQAVIAIQNARLFREIQEKSRQLEIANKHKSEFLANMSHELRTPLNAIIGFSEVLLERMFGELNEKQDDYLKDIHSSGRHLLSLINDILDLSKIEAGRMELEPSSFELAAALSNAMTLVRERAQRHSIVMGQQVDAQLGEIVADERKFKQILVNLLTNAVKFTPDGGRIDVIARREDGAAVIAVHDTGIGIAPEDQLAVFEEFRQVGRDYTNKQEGTGLGLALTKKFVELHGGRIWLESEPGKGSTFTFTIPLGHERAEKN